LLWQNSFLSAVIKDEIKKKLNNMLFKSRI